MKKTILFLAIALQVVLSAGSAFAAHNDSVMLCYRIPGTGNVALTYKQLRADSIWLQVEFNTAHDFSGVPDIKPLHYSAHAVGIHTDTLPVMSGALLYVRLTTRDSAFVWNVSDTDTMYQYPVITATVTPTTNGFTQSITMDGGNDAKAKLESKVIWDTTSWGFYYFDSVISGLPIGGPRLRTSSITSMSYPGHGWVRNILTNRLGVDTTFDYFSVVPPVLPPTTSWYGTPSIVGHTVYLDALSNAFGYPGATETFYIKHLPTGLPFDSVTLTLSSGYGPQHLYPSFGSLTADDTFYVSGKIHALTTVPLANVTVITPPEFTLAMTGSIGIHHDTLRSRVNYTNVPGYSCNITVNLVDSTGAIVDWQNFPYNYGSGNINLDFVVTYPGPYTIFASGYDDVFTMIDSTNLLSCTVLPTLIDTVYAASDTTYVGLKDTIYTSVIGANDVSATGFGWIHSDKDTLVTPVFTTPGTYTYTVTASGFSSATKIVTIQVLPVLLPLSVQNVNTVLRIYPNPTADNITIETADDRIGTYRITDMTGKVVDSFQSNGITTTHSLSDLASGEYLLFSSQENNFKKKITIRH